MPKIYQAKEVKDVYNENFKPLEKRLEKVHVVEMPMLPKVIYNIICFKITMAFFIEVGKKD